MNSPLEIHEVRLRGLHRGPRTVVASGLLPKLIPLLSAFSSFNWLLAVSTYLLSREPIWQHLGAAIDMLENAITACPDALYSDRAQRPEFWYVVYHTLFFLDFYLSEREEGFAPPPPFTLDELDPAGVLPERVYTKDELLRYLRHGREKSRALVEGLTDERAAEVRPFLGREWTVLEWLLLSLRHVQHHTAQLNLILRQQTDSAPGWVSQTQHPLDGTESPT
ncbi:MAG TPA: DinB family protein [Longimicrobium sp.]